MKLRLPSALCSLFLISSTSFVMAEAPVNQLTESEQRSGWELLFDGKSTAGWRNYKSDKISEGWTVQDGALVRDKKGAGDIVTDKKYESFELSLDYKISEGGNSGVMFHVVEDYDKPWNSGPEVQIQDNKAGHDPQHAGWLYQLYKPPMVPTESGESTLDMTRPAGQWNQLYIRIAKSDCEVCLNGVRYFQFKLGDEKWNQAVAASKFAEFENFAKAGAGHICLQDHGNLVSFRNIKVRELEKDGLVKKQPIDGELNLKGVVAFPNLKWDQWEAVDDSGKVRMLRLMELTYPNDGTNRLFAVSQDGAIWTFKNEPDVSKSHLFLDLRGKAYEWWNGGANEQGLLGFAIHPDFKSNGYVYVYYSHADNKRSIVSRFTVSKDDPNKADPDSELVLMDIEQPYQNHNGGSIEFGPDGYLYIGLGDGGFRNDPHGHGQNLSTLLGSILRIDVDHPAKGMNYGIPSDNPFVDVKDARPEIYAYGIRNPWRLAFDKKTGTLWCGEVGQELWEEVLIIKKGHNYGWSVAEGTHPFGKGSLAEGAVSLTGPVWEYDHRIGRSITGGRVYRNPRMPILDGKYLYGDYVSGRIWALSYDAASDKVTRNEQIIPDTVAVVGFGEDQNGEVYYLTGNSRGECIYRFEQ
jgi:glucose/arabinose dehydrogenase